MNRTDSNIPNDVARVNDFMYFSFAFESEIALVVNTPHTIKRFILDVEDDSLWREVVDNVKKNRSPRFYKWWWKLKHYRNDVSIASHSFDDIV